MYWEYRSFCIHIWIFLCLADKIQRSLCKMQGHQSSLSESWLAMLWKCWRPQSPQCTHVYSCLDWRGNHKKIGPKYKVLPQQHLTPKSWLFERWICAQSLSLVHVNLPQVWFSGKQLKSISWCTSLTWSSDRKCTISASLLHKVSLGCCLI